MEVLILIGIGNNTNENIGISIIISQQFSIIYTNKNIQFLVLVLYIQDLIVVHTAHTVDKKVPIH